MAHVECSHPAAVVVAKVITAWITCPVPPVIFLRIAYRMEVHISRVLHMTLCMKSRSTTGTTFMKLMWLPVIK